MPKIIAQKAGLVQKKTAALGSAAHEGGKSKKKSGQFISELPAMEVPPGFGYENVRNNDFKIRYSVIASISGMALA